MYLDTNGYLLTKSVVKQLKDNGLELLNISIDSPIPEKHDERRGLKGCFKKAVEGIKKSVDLGLKCAIPTVATKENVYNGELEGVIELGRKLGVTGVQILLPIPCGRWLHNFDAVLTPNEEEEVRMLIDFPFVFRSFYF